MNLTAVIATTTNVESARSAVATCAGRRRNSISRYSAMNATCHSTRSASTHRWTAHLKQMNGEFKLIFHLVRLKWLLCYNETIYKRVSWRLYLFASYLDQMAVKEP